LALAEAGSGGTLTQALIGADAGGQVLVGAYAAPTVEKLCHMLGTDNDNGPGDSSGGQKIKRLAAATADATASQWAIAVGEARRDENGSGYVDVVFKLPDGRLEIRQVRLRGTGELARSRLSTQLLEQLRRRLK